MNSKIIEAVKRTELLSEPEERFSRITRAEWDEYYLDICDLFGIFSEKAEKTRREKRNSVRDI
jgi:hypothetical protein